MSSILPASFTVNDAVIDAMKDAGALGIGQSPTGQDIYDGQARLQRMLQQWNQERYLIYHLVTYTVPSTGQITPYTVGPGGQISVGANGMRPNRIESAFFQQLNTTPQGPVQYPLRLIETMEDYRKISLPNLQTFSLCAFYDPAWPNGQLYVWPWPQATNYVVGIVAREQLPVQFAAPASTIVLPYAYHRAIVSNLAMELRPKYGIVTQPGDPLPSIAKAAKQALRKGNTAIAEMDMPAGLVRNGLYNIYSDQNY